MSYMNRFNQEDVVRVPGQYDADAVSLQTGLKCEDPSRTVQDQAEDTDINVMVKRFGITGEMPKNVRMPLEGEFFESLDLKDAMNVMNEATRAFMKYPAEVRERFGHDPVKMVQFLSDPENLAEARKLGLAEPEAAPPPPVEPQLVRIVQDEPAPKA